jgi:CubicO group peptidase (beta-lactamase class C family)
MRFQPSIILASLLVLSALTQSSHVQALVPLPTQQADVPWPTKDWPMGAPQGVDLDALAKMMALTQRVETNGLGETRALVIIQHGKLVAESYAADIKPETRHISWSAAKSITQALVGIAVSDHLIDIDQPMGNSHWSADDPRAKIPWRNWLNMVDGQDYYEIGADAAHNDAARMNYGIGRRDPVAFAASLPLIHKPGDYWNYNSAGINLIADALTNRIVPDPNDATDRRNRMMAFMKARLFDRIGMTQTQPQFDPQGTFVGASQIYASAREFAKFGLLYLRDGMWEGQRLLPEGWVDFARTKTPAPNSNFYGAGWWIAPPKADRTPSIAANWGQADDLFRAQGHLGQLIVVVPSKDLVVVRLGKIDESIGWPVLAKWTGALVDLFPDNH